MHHDSNDRNASRAPQAAMAANPLTSTSEISVIDLTTPNPSPQRPRGPVIMSFSSSGALVRSSVSPIRSSNISTIRSSNVTSLHREDTDIVVLEVCRAEDGLADANRNLLSPQQRPISISSSMVELLPETSPSRPRRQVSQRPIYEGSLVQPRKRRKC